MPVRNRSDWSRHIEGVIRSQHYTRLGEGLGGEPFEQALANITTDIMHICQRQGIPWDVLLDRSQAQYEQEESQAARTMARAG